MRKLVKRLALRTPRDMLWRLSNDHRVPYPLRSFSHYRRIEQDSQRMAEQRARLLSFASFQLPDDEVRGAPVVSFDFYDTLFTRLTASPTDIFGFMGHVLLLRSGRASAKDFLHLRQSAESIARNRRRPDQELPGDVGLDGIYCELGPISGWPDDLVAEAQSLELALEEQVLVMRGTCVEAARRLCADGTRLIIVSDTYMSGAFLSRVLERHGIRSLFSRIYASSDTGRRKDNGTLWSWLLEKEGTVTEFPLVHIGDNPHSDVAVPRRYGVRPVAVANTADLAQARGFPVPAVSSTGWRAGIALGPAVARIGNDPFMSPATPQLDIPDIAQFGYAVLGPLMFGFMSWLLRMLREQRISRVFFLSRDGFFMRRIYRSICERYPSSTLPESDYLFVSRRSAIPAATGVSFDTALILRNLFDGSLAALLRGRLGLDAHALWPEAEAKAAVKLPRDAARVAALLASRTREITAACAAGAANLRTYLGTAGFLERNDIAVVDLGYSGTIQHCLQIVSGRGLTGFYFRMTPEAALLARSGGRGVGYFSSGVGDDKFLPVRMASVFLEAVLAAPHGQVTGYDASGSPMYEPKPDVGADYELLLELANGMERYCLDLIDAVGPDALSFEVPPQHVQEPLLAVIRGVIAIPERLRPALIMVDEFCREETRISGPNLFQ